MRQKHNVFDKSLSVSSRLSNAIAHKLVAHSVGNATVLHAETIDQRRLRVMFRPGTGHCPPMLGLSWLNLSVEKNKALDSYPVRLHKHDHRGECVGRDECEMFRAPTIYEVIDTDSGDKVAFGREVVGAWVSTLDVPSRPTGASAGRRHLYYSPE